jgi:hypothetical protein
MIEFSSVTPFRFARSIAVAGLQNPAIYLLICDAEAAAAVAADLVAEIDIQLGAAVEIETASELRANGLKVWRDGSIRLVLVDQWIPELVDSLDRHSAVLVQDGGKLLLLATKELAERILRRAPNLRNRLTDIVQINPEGLAGGQAG